MIKTPAPKFTIRHTTALSQARTEIEALLTREGVERFLTEIGRGTLEAHVSAEKKEQGTADANGVDHVGDAGDESTGATSGALATDKLALGDTVTVSLPNLEFAGLTGLAQMIAAAKVPEKMKPMIEKSPVFAKVGAGLDMAYGLLRGGLTFSSKITSWDSNAESLTYVDEGVALPKVLKSWKHTHKFSDNGEGTMITDELEVEVDPALAAPVIEGALRMHLESRGKAYKKVLDQI